MKSWTLLVLAVLGGLLLAGGTVASWVVAEGTRQVAEVSVPDARQTTGVAFAPLAVPVGVLAALCGLALALRAGRRAVGAVIALLGIIGAVALAVGLIQALADAGQLTIGPAVAAAGAGGLIAAGWLAVRRPPRPDLPSRYTVEAARQASDHEWQLASEESE
jgi:tryptophan-associated transmembrane protein